MTMDSFELYFDILTLICSCYVLYTVIKLRMQGKLFPNQLLIPRGSEIEECLDEDGYIAYVTPRLWILGLVVLALGLFCMADGQWHISQALFPAIEKIEFIVSEGCIVLSLVALIWYMFCWSKAKKLFWL